MKNTTSYFPTQIDDRFFFSDADLDNLITVGQYQTLITQGKYTEAVNLINNNIYEGTQFPETDFYGAWVLNLLENRLHNIGEYLTTSPEIQKPELVKYQDVSPHKTSPLGMNWVGEIVLEDPSNVFLGEDIPTDGENGDIYIDLDGTTEYVDSADRTIYYQENEPANGDDVDIYQQGIGMDSKIATLEKNQEWFG